MQYPYHYKIRCAAPDTLSPTADFDQLLFETYACLLVESRVLLDAALTPLQPLVSGVLLTFRSSMRQDEVERCMRHLVHRCNRRSLPVTLVARRVTPALPVAPRPLAAIREVSHA
jgi:hypothetical protein